MKHQRKIRHKSWRNSSSKPSNMELGSVTNTIVSSESEMGKGFCFFQNCLQNCCSLFVLKKIDVGGGREGHHWVFIMESFYGSDEYSSVGLIPESQWLQKVMLCSLFCKWEE